MTPVQCVARVAHPTSSKEKWLAVFIAYFDSGGHPSDRPSVSLAGVVAPEKQWKAFEKSWNKVLRRFGFEVMHMTDFAGRHDPYDKLNEHDRRECHATLTGILKKAMVFGSVHIIPVKEWDEIILPIYDTPAQAKRGWFIFLMRQVLIDIRQVVKLPPGEKIACVFDRDKTMAYAAMRFYDDFIESRGWGDFFGSVTFVKDEDNKLEERFVPLQGADMVAFEGNRRFVDKVLKNDPEQRKSLTNLTSNFQITAAHYDRTGLENLKRELMKIREAMKRYEQGED